ncbi:STAS/SEC14 domain-containing protein [Sorangium sp. So ce136]|uniref:STAS/SEC14 domain-containing protein n=1 Tax=Sorangium sp. So ce136 TaxID=3133284 RepID=UPI003F05A8B7
MVPRYDDSSWPLFRVVLPEEELSEQEFAELTDTLDGLFLRGGKFAVLMDARAAPPLAAKRRQVLGARGAAAYERHPGKMAGFAVVLRSPLQRGIFTAIHWIVRPRHEARAFSTLADAEEWLRSRLRAAGAEVTAAAAPR